MFNAIRRAIIDKLNNESTKLEVAYPTYRSTFDGFPAAVVTPSENEADYSSGQSDRRAYVFTVTVYYPLPSESEAEATDHALGETIDELIELFSNRGALGTVCDWVEPVPSVWQDVEQGDTPYRTGELTLRCVKYTA